MGNNKRTNTQLFGVQDTHLRLGVHEYEKGGDKKYHFSLHFKRTHHMVILASAWYYELFYCAFDASYVLENIKKEVKRDWITISNEQPLINYLINEINAKYFAEIASRENFRAGALLPAIVSNGRDGLERRFERFELRKLNHSKLHRKEFESYYRTWEELPFKLPR